MDITKLKSGDIVLVTLPCWLGSQPQPQFLAEVVDVSLTDKVYPVSCLLPYACNFGQFASTSALLKTRYPGYKLAQHNFWFLAAGEILEVITDLTW